MRHLFFSSKNFKSRGVSFICRVENTNVYIKDVSNKQVPDIVKDAAVLLEGYTEGFPVCAYFPNGDKPRFLKDFTFPV